MALKTFADVKRRIEVGTKLDMTYYRPSRVALPTLPVRRTVLIVQSNAVAMTAAFPGKTGPSWLYWGKASECRVDGPDTFSILEEDGEVIATYRFV